MAKKDNRVDDILSLAFGMGITIPMLLVRKDTFQQMLTWKGFRSQPGADGTKFFYDNDFGTVEVRMVE